jgi:hypothetical protein
LRRFESTPALRRNKLQTFINLLLPDLIRNPSSQTAPVQSQSGDGRSTMSRNGVRFPETAFRDLTFCECRMGPRSYRARLKSLG